MEKQPEYRKWKTTTFRNNLFDQIINRLLNITVKRIITWETVETTAYVFYKTSFNGSYAFQLRPDGLELVNKKTVIGYIEYCDKIQELYSCVSDITAYEKQIGSTSDLSDLLVILEKADS